VSGALYLDGQDNDSPVKYMGKNVYDGDTQLTGTDYIEIGKIYTVGD
jgi:hypothetical protein